MESPSSSLRSFTELVAWQKARVVRRSVIRLVKTWPAEEKFRLSDQIVRSSRSVCANIAEGHGRFYEKDNLRFCRLAKGSMTETMDHLTAAYDEGFIDAASVKAEWAKCEEVLRVLNGYINHLKRMGKRSEVAEPLPAYGDVAASFFELPAGPIPSSEVFLTTDN